MIITTEGIRSMQGAYGDNTPFSGRPICTFFAMGGCMKGERCPFSHDLTQEAPDGVDVSGGFYISGRVANYKAASPDPPRGGPAKSCLGNTREAAEPVLHALPSPRVLYCDSEPNGSPVYHTPRPQSSSNTIYSGTVSTLGNTTDGSSAVWQQEFSFDETAYKQQPDASTVPPSWHIQSFNSSNTPFSNKTAARGSSLQDSPAQDLISDCMERNQTPIHIDTQSLRSSAAHEAHGSVTSNSDAGICQFTSRNPPPPLQHNQTLKHAQQQEHQKFQHHQKHVGGAVSAPPAPRSRLQAQLSTAAVKHVPAPRSAQVLAQRQKPSPPATMVRQLPSPMAPAVAATHGVPVRGTNTAEQYGEGRIFYQAGKPLVQSLTMPPILPPVDKYITERAEVQKDPFFLQEGGNCQQVVPEARHVAQLVQYQTVQIVTPSQPQQSQQVQYVVTPSLYPSVCSADTMRPQVQQQQLVYAMQALGNDTTRQPAVLRPLIQHEQPPQQQQLVTVLGNSTMPVSNAEFLLVDPNGRIIGTVPQVQVDNAAFQVVSLHGR